MVFADLGSAGRFFANHLLKLLLSQIVMRYDIKHDTEPRPQNPVSYTHLPFTSRLEFELTDMVQWFSYVSPPPIGYKLSVRRRKQ